MTPSLAEHEYRLMQIESEMFRLQEQRIAIKNQIVILQAVAQSQLDGENKPDTPGATPE